MKVVINGCWGGFGLSEAAKRELEKAGVVAEQRFSRHDPRLVEVVERLGDAANTRHSRLVVVDLKDETTYFITEYDGSESLWTPKTAPWITVPSAKRELEPTPTLKGGELPEEDE